MIEDTSKRDPLLHMAGMLGGDYITGLEAQGQHQIVRSDLLPSDGPWADLEALGFRAGPVKADDPLFREVTLPAGWSREGGDHNMWSCVVDERGLRRVSVFYKAAPYDRRAHCGILDVALSDCLKHGHADEICPLHGWSCRPPRRPPPPMDPVELARLRAAFEFAKVAARDWDRMRSDRRDRRE